MRQLQLDMPAIFRVFCFVTGGLPVEVDLVLFGVGGVEIFRCHFENLSDGNEKVEKVDDFDAGILFVELLVFGPPFPRNAVGEFGNLLGHGAAVVEHPLNALLFGHVGGVDADFEIERFLHLENFVELVRWNHAGSMREFRWKCIFFLLCYKTLTAPV